MIKKCIGCGSTLQSENILEEGYVKASVYPTAEYCERCFKITHYGETSVLEKNVDIMNFLKTIDTKIPVLYLVDLTCISQTIFMPLKKIKNKVYLILTKRDLLPKSVKDKKIISYIKDNYFNKEDIIIISSEKKRNIDELYNKLIKDKVHECFILGFSNSGKSSLVNSLLESRGKKAYITTSPIPNTTTSLINIELDNNLKIIDTPGFNNEKSISNFIDLKEYKKFFPKKEIKPKIYELKPGFMIILENFMRIENNTDEQTTLIFYLENNLNYKKMKVTTSEYLKKLNKKDIIFNGQVDLVIEGLGFIKIPNYSKLTFYIENNIILTKRNKMI